MTLREGEYLHIDRVDLRALNQTNTFVDGVHGKSLYKALLRAVLGVSKSQMGDAT